MPRDLVDRRDEMGRLRELAARDRRSMALVTGRRRVGKTYLLRHCWPDRPVFHFTASNIAAAQNRRALLIEAERWAETTLRPEDHPTWRTALRTLLELRPDQSIVVVLDEVQYLADDPSEMSGFASELNAAWESDLRRDAPLLLVLSGSAIGTLEALNEGDAPLFGRFAWHGKLKPFDYFWASRMVSPYGPEKRVATYAAFGGTPLYLDAVDTGKTVGANIVAQLMSPEGMVRTQLETAVEQELGLRDVQSYRGILAAVGQKRPTAGEIAAALDREKDSWLQQMLQNLIDLDYLERTRNFGAASNRPYRYRLADPAFRFFHGFVVPNESAIETAGAASVWRERIAGEAWSAYVGQHVFEDVVAQAYLRFQGERDLPEVGEWGRWEGQTPEGASVEIDVVSRLLDDRMLTGSIKYRSQPADAGVWLDHVRALERLEHSGRRWVHEALAPDAPFLFVSRGGFTEAFRQVAAEHGERETMTWTLEDLW